MTFREKGGGHSIKNQIQRHRVQFWKGQRGHFVHAVRQMLLCQENAGRDNCAEPVGQEIVIGRFFFSTLSASFFKQEALCFQKGHYKEANLC